MKNDAVRKVQSVFTLHARNQPYRSLPEITVSVLNWRGLFNHIDYCTVPGQFRYGYSIAVCMVMLFCNYPRVIIFHLQCLSLYHPSLIDVKRGQFIVSGEK